MANKPLVLMILDGLGCGEPGPGNAVTAAGTPRLDALFDRWPVTQIAASGLDVGLPAGQMGNSEVGHTNIGAGRIVYQELTRITRAVEEGDFFHNPALCGAVEHCLREGGSLHLMGLLSDGGVHSHIHHLKALVRLADMMGLSRVFLHCFMDGRDVSPTSGAGFLQEITQFCENIGVGQVATVSGRYYAMDRDNRWDRVQKAYQVLTEPDVTWRGDAAEYARQQYEAGITDEFLPPVRLREEGIIRSGDSVVFFNFRPDRARELSHAFLQADFNGFDRPRGFLPLYYVTMTQYDEALSGARVAFAPEELHNTLGEVVSRAGLKQLRIAETEKYAHVTYFFNGGVEPPLPQEERILVPSPKVATYDLMPGMSAGQVTERLLQALGQDCPDFVVLNFANCDMVGHTGNLPAAIEAVQTVDEMAGRVVDKVLAMGGVVLITADHGNAEQLLDAGGQPMTAHTANPVPFGLIGREANLREGGRLADIAPTVLQLLGLPQPAEMTGESLLL